ncbi:recombinase RecF, partial [Clostridium botulinum]|nr:recombinase RecF [Clostridium botulinum]
YKIIADEYDKFKNNEKIIVLLSNQKDLYDSNSPIIKAMRYIVDNQKVYEIYKQENNVCPLCGSETFPENEVGKIAKKFLGEKDKERQSLIKEINEYTENNEVIIGKIKELVISSIESQLNEINNILKLRGELQDIFLLAKELEIDIQKISIELLTCEKIKLEEEISGLQIENVKELDIIHLLLELKSPFLLKYINELKSYNDEYYEKNVLLLSQMVDELQKNRATIKYSINNNEYKTSTLNLIKDKLDITKEIVLYKTNNSISCEIKNINKDISNFEKELKAIKEKIEKAQTFITKIKRVKTNSEKNETRRIAEPLSVIYKKITRNTNINEINLKKGNASKKSSLDIIDSDGNNIPFGNIMSAGQVSTLAISIYFAKAILNKNRTFKLYMMDDPIQTMDDLNVISLIDLLRFQFMQPKENRFIDQLFISTCDDDLEKLIFHKMNSFGISIINQNFIGEKY